MREPAFSANTVASNNFAAPRTLDVVARTAAPESRRDSPTFQTALCYFPTFTSLTITMRESVPACF
jgi:hypothetical protein